MRRLTGHWFLCARFGALCRHLAASRRPVVIGPWRSEVGFEVLYWLPFLAAVRERYGLDKSRLIALARGGTGVWYDTAGTADLYDHVPPDVVRLHTFAAHQQQQSIKQLVVEPWERHAVGLAAASLGLSHPLVLHPSWMYRLLTPYWTDHGVTRLRPYKVTPLPVPPVPPNLKLPEKFVAVRLYARPTFAAGEEVMLWLKRLIARVAQHQPVVVLNSGARYDDHADLLAGDGQRIHDISAICTPTTNLAVQAAVLARASAFIGTYGGLSQVAVRYRVPTVALYTDWHSTAMAHVDLTQRIALAQGSVFMLARPKDGEHLERLLTGCL